MASKRRNKKGAPGHRNAAPSPADRAALAAVEQLNRGNVQAAAGIIDQGLRAKPDHSDLLHLAGQISLMQGQQAQGRELVERAVGLAPDIALFRVTLGNVYVVDGQPDRALEQFRKAVRLNPRLADAHANIGIALAREGRQAEAAAAFENAVRLQPDDLQAHLNLAVCETELRHADKAAAAVAQVERLVSDPPPDILHVIGNIYRALGNTALARRYYERALAGDAQQSGVWYALADVLARDGEYDQADAALREAEDRGFDRSRLRLAQGRVASGRGDLDGARRLLGDALAAAGDDHHQLIRIATQYTLLGDFDAEERCLQRALEIDPDNAAAFAGLALAPGRVLGDAEAGRLRRLADDTAVDVDIRVQIGFALGNHYRYMNDFETSFRYYRLGNRLKGYRFDHNAYLRWIEQVERRFDRAFFAERADWGSRDKLPVLIVGMPRSGTTLTEQVLSAHPAIFGAGEYGKVAALAAVDGLPEPDFRQHPDRAAALTRDDVAAHSAAYLAKMRALAGAGERFVTNKLPHNFEHLGLFGLLFPDAPVIHVTRDPRDNLLSVYFQDFAAIHDYAYDLKSLGRHYRLYQRVTAHWLAVIPNPVLTLSYEDLVADLAGKSRELADFIGVPFDNAMLRFYEQDRMVQTASKWQVRQKLYSTSVGRWQPYAKHLKPLFDALGPLD